MVPVKTGRVYESSAAADRGWTTWARWNDDKDTYFAKREGARRIRLNARGTSADAGGISGRIVVFSQAPTWYGMGDIYRFNLRTRRRSAFPPIVNRRAHEANPTMSGKYLLFDRTPRRRGGSATLQVLLFDRSTQQLRHLIRWFDSGANGAGAGLEAGQVNGDFAVFERSSWHEENRDGTWGVLSSARIVRYRISSGTRETVVEESRFNDWNGQNVGGSMYGPPAQPAVSADGTAYYWRTYYDENNDVARTDLFRQPIGAASERIGSAPGDLKAGDTFVDDLRDGSRHVYFTWKGNIYKVIDPPPAG